MPYTDGGLVNSACTSCYDNDEGALKELCSTLYDYAAYRCEEDWSVNHYYYDSITEVNKYGLDTTGCKSIAHFNWTMPKINVWEELAFSIILVGVAVAGWFYYSSWWAKRKYCEKSLDFCVVLMDGISQMDSFICICLSGWHFSEKENLERIDTDDEGEDDDDGDDYYAHTDDDDYGETTDDEPVGTMA